MNVSSVNMKDFLDLANFLKGDGWVTPNTYCSFFQEPGNEPAIYMFIAFGDLLERRVLVAYVGMSTRLTQRLCGHPIKADLSKNFHYVQTWFKPTPPVFLRKEEAAYIKMFDPAWNIQGRNRGVAFS